MVKFSYLGTLCIDRLSVWYFMQDRAAFYEDFFYAYKDQVPLVDIVKHFISSSDSSHFLVRRVYEKILYRLSYTNFSGALSGFVPSSELVMIKALEESNRLGEGLMYLSHTVQDIKKIKRLFLSFLISILFPIIILFLLIVVFYEYISPILMSFSAVDQWPTEGRVLYFLGDIVTHYSFLFLLGGMTFFILILISFPRWIGSLRIWFDYYFPIYKLYRIFHSYYFLISLSYLFSINMSLIDAMNVLMCHENRWVRFRIAEIVKKITMYGQYYAKAFNVGFFDKKIEKRILLLSDRVDFSEAIRRIGQNDQSFLMQTLIDRLQSIRSISLVLLGGLLLGVFLSFYSTVYSIESYSVITQY